MNTDEREENALALDDAIAEYEDLTENQLKFSEKWKVWKNGECEQSRTYEQLAENNRQLAEWLKELKTLKNAESQRKSAEPCTDAVSRNWIRQDISDSLNQMTKIGIAVDGEWLWAKINDALDNAPSVQPERPKGKWVRCGTDGCKCSECGAKIDIREEFRSFFCYHCGADMRGES